MPIQDYNLPAPGQGMVNALIARDEIANRRQYNAMSQQRIDNEMAQYEDEQQQGAREAQELQSLQHGWAELQAAGNNPQRRAQIAAEIKAKAPQLAQLDDEEVLRQTEEMLRLRLGIEAPPGPVSYQKTPWGGQLGMQDGKKVAEWNPPQPQQYAPPAPNRDIELARWYEGATPEQRAAYDATHPKSGGGAADGKPPELKEKDKTVGVLYGSMVGAENDINKLAGGPTTASLWNAGLDAVPFDRGLFRNLQSDAYRQYESAALRWAANLLYIKSGATAPPEEVRSTYKQFFPQPGDGDETIKQKALSRQQEKANIEAVYPEVTGKVNSTNAQERADIPPPAALRQLKEGQVTTFANGQRWTLKDGKAIQVQ